MTLEKKIIEIRRHLHRNPELSGQEFNTTTYIEKMLKNLNYKTKRLTKTGVVGYIYENQPCIAIRADIDALPINEETNLPYKSRVKNVMHACGHDANTAIVLGCAIIFKQQKINKNIKFIFQPSEETANGANILIKNGVLKNPDVKAIIGIHVNPHIPKGKVGIKYGEMLAGVSRFKIKFFDGGGHAAYPHKGKDTILASSELITLLQQLKSRQIDPVEPCVVSICKIKGGERFNVLASEVVMEGTTRVLNPTLHSRIKKSILDLTKYIAKRYGLKYYFSYDVIGYPLKNSGKITDICYETAVKYLGKKNVLTLEKPSMGGEDFAEYLRYIPGCFFYIGAKSSNGNYPWHHPKFKIDESVLPLGANLLFEIVKNFYKFEI